MSRTSRVLAGLAGFVVAFLFVMMATALTPSGGLEEDRALLLFDQFSFHRGSVTAAEGATLEIRNSGPVPATFSVQGPAGDNASRTLEPDQSWNLTLVSKGSYEVGVEPYSWGVATAEVRSDNPFVRFFEDVF